MSSLFSRLESLLFVASKPLSTKEIARSLSVSIQEVDDVVSRLQVKFSHEDSGLHIVMNGSEVQMQTNPANAQDVERFVKYEISGELTKAQLESLTIIAYRGTITRPELEQIRGVNCAVILRTLQMRDLVIEENDEYVVQRFRISLAALAHLGVHTPEELPEYAEIHTHQHIDQALQQDDI